MKSVDRVPTGIKGFDELLEGGLPKKKVILISGTPGTAKTIFSLQYLYNGATKYHEKGMYVTFEEPAASLKSQALQFGWDFNKLEKQHKVKILSIPPKYITERTASEIIDLANENKCKRLVVDSLSALSLNTPTTHIQTVDITEISIKRFLYRFINDLRNVDATTLLVSQTAKDQLSQDNVSEFICDGIININYETLGGEQPRSLTIRKMRETKNDQDVHPLHISPKGLLVKDYKE